MSTPVFGKIKNDNKIGFAPKVILTVIEDTCSFFKFTAGRILPYGVFLGVFFFFFQSVLFAQPDFFFDQKGISEKVLRHYLARSVTMAELLTPDPFCVNGSLPDKEDDIRMVLHLKAKFIGRAIYRWGTEDVLSNTVYLEKARKIADRIHQKDPEVVLQAALFEMISPKVNMILIPEWVFKEFNLPVESRHFDYQKMLNLHGRMVNHWGKSGSVPDITRQESQMWFLYLTGTYLRLGCEALHLGQIALLGMNDPDLEQWENLINRIRSFAKTHARRGWVILDAHTPTGGMVRNGKSLLDFNSFPLRIKEIPSRFMECELAVGYLDGLYMRSKGGITASGWSCPSLPFLVEFDNYGCNGKPGVADTTSHFVWGFDEITWFFLQKESVKQQWLHYAKNWLESHDSNAYLEMPGCRLVTFCNGEPIKIYHGNTRSPQSPEGQNVENTIWEIWNKKESLAKN